jgi:hypothetical protein
MAWTRSDRWVWGFVLVDHDTDEAWAHVAKVGTDSPPFSPFYDAVIDRFGGLGPDVARAIKLRYDWDGQTRFNRLSQHRLPRLARDPRRCRLCGRTGVQPPSGQTLHPHPEGAVPVGRALRGIWATCAKPWPASASSTKPSGSSSHSGTRHHGRRTQLRPRIRRDSHRNCPTNRGLDRASLDHRVTRRRSSPH